MNGQKTEGNEMDILLLAGGAFLIGAIILFFFRVQILSFLLWIKYYELELISYFVPDRVYQGLQNWVKLTPAQRVSYDQLMLLSNEVGDTLKYPCMVVTIILGFALAFFHPKNSFNSTESMASLGVKLHDDFPNIQVVAGFDLVTEPIDEGLWAMGQTPIEFGRKHKLLYRDSETQVIMVDRLKAKVIFCQQLGPLWPGIDHLPAYQKALFAAFAAFASYQRDEAELFLANIERLVTKNKLIKGNLDFPGTDTLLKKYGHSPVVKDILEKHAYLYTAFTEMLVAARRSGIVANSSYLWVKPLDRPLWYTLNNVGRKAIFTEMAAVHAHWLAEKKLGFALTEPMVEEAIHGLQEAARSRIVRDIIL
ncbi:MAG: type IVB secretion system coupling complex protein DotM/IcmP [Gammaproteobacteria bacterium]|nr:type IVB secretion system coupling complex protein DotM/IcmP [Gammaproteobacteria bacterium]